MDEETVLILAGAAAYFLFCYSRYKQASTDPNYAMGTFTREFCLPASLLAAGLLAVTGHVPL